MEIIYSIEHKIAKDSEIDSFRSSDMQIKNACFDKIGIVVISLLYCFMIIILLLHA
jgi:hypothetical protein